jgi:pseudouridine-5'-phosphate glycosidase
LGNNGEYLELSTDEIINSAEITALTDSTEEVDNGIGAINGSDTEVEETITINNVTYTDETFTQFWSGKSETESKVFTKKLKGQSSAYLSRIVSILESKGIKVTEEMQNKIKELYNLTC